MTKKYSFSGSRIIEVFISCSRVDTVSAPQRLNGPSLAVPHSMLATDSLSVLNDTRPAVGLVLVTLTSLGVKSGSAEAKKKVRPTKTPPTVRRAINTPTKKINKPFAIIQLVILRKYSDRRIYMIYIYIDPSPPNRRFRMTYKYYYTFNNTFPPTANNDSITPIPNN